MADAKFDVPESFYCPITQEVMEDPVIDPDGNSFERKAIESWLAKHNTSPITRNPMRISDLRPNRALQESIQLLGKLIDLKKVATKKPVPLSLPGSPDVAPLSVSILGNKSHAVVTIQPPKGKTRTPCDICCVVDTSGSMGSEAMLKTSENKTESHGLSVMDVVKHAMKTIIHSLNANDRLSIVTFATKATLLSSSIIMDEQGKKSAISALERLDPDGNTNLWDGLSTGMDVLRNNSSDGRNSAILLLTDGEPNVVPPRGHVPMLKRYKEKYPGFNCIINTFGFGYTLDSELLNELSVEGTGTYAFIPDSSFVGTVFVHSLSNLLTTTATNLVLTLEPLNGGTIKSIVGEHLSTNTGNEQNQTRVLRLGSIQYGQTKDIVVNMDIPSDNYSINYSQQQYLRAKLVYRQLNKPDASPVEIISEHTTFSQANGDIEKHRIRSKCVEVIFAAMKFMKHSKQKEANGVILDFIKEIKTSEVATDTFIAALLEDLEGQVTEAISKNEWYTKWGRHYLPSLAAAHLNQQCNNFKDPGVQFYGGDGFAELRDKIDDLFCKLPPPKPSNYLRPASNTSHAPAPVVTNMSVYNNYSNPCFDGSCSVLLGDSSTKRVDEIRKGDMVQSCGATARVLCVVKTKCVDGKSYLVELDSGLLVTPWHPIRLQNNGNWCFPSSLKTPVHRECPAVYSFLLESGHVMIINDIECVTLGHSFNNCPVVSHPYFGSRSDIIHDLEHMVGWQEGHIELEGSTCIVRDTTGLICGLRQLRPKRLSEKQEE